MQNKDEALGTQPIGKLMLSLALPAVAAQFINMLYNIVDRIYIGNIPGTGALALTGVGVTFPIILLVSAFAAFAGMGGAPLASIQLGAGNREGAEKILGNCFSMLLVLSVTLTVIFSIFKTPLLYMFGASDAIIGYAEDYISIYLAGTIFVQLALGLNTFISAQGHATVAMLSVLIGAVINIVLDPVFIFVFGMGVSGAALATILSQAVSAAWVLRFLFSAKSGIRIRRGNMKFEKRVVGKVIGLGIAPFIMQKHREPCEYHAERRAAALRRRPVRGQHDHYAERDADARHAHPGHHTGRATHYELQLRRQELQPRAQNFQPAAQGNAARYRLGLCPGRAPSPAAGAHVHSGRGA